MRFMCTQNDLQIMISYYCASLRNGSEIEKEPANKIVTRILGNQSYTYLCLQDM